MNESTSLIEARHAMDLAAAKAPGGQRDRYVPFLRAAIIFWTLQEKTARALGEMEVELQAVAERITLEDQFRESVGRSFNTQTDEISLADVLSLPEG